MPEVGDRVHIASTKLGQAPRDGVVTGLVGRLLRIKWSTGEESTVAPGPGSVAVVGKVRKSAGKKTAVPSKAVKATKSAKKANATKTNVNGRLAKKESTGEEDRQALITGEEDRQTPRTGEEGCGTSEGHEVGEEQHEVGHQVGEDLKGCEVSQQAGQEGHEEADSVGPSRRGVHVGVARPPQVVSGAFEPTSVPMTVPVLLPLNDAAMPSKR